MKSRVPALVVIVSGIVFFVAGVATYAIVSTTLAEQNITVSDDAAAFGGQTVDQPWEAYAQADVIGKHAEGIADGKTYAELPQDDPRRPTMMNASFLQASLFTSVVAFGVAVMAAVLGILLVIIGLAIRPVGRSSQDQQQVAAATSAPAG